MTAVLSLETGFTFLVVKMMKYLIVICCRGTLTVGRKQAEQLRSA